MELVDEFGDLWTHHGEDVRSSPRGKGVNASPRHQEEHPRIDHVAFPIEFDLELSVEADERFLAAMMHVERSLIVFARVEPPVPDHEVGHEVDPNELDPTSFELGRVLQVAC
jgi:hypothetical protein